MKVLVFLEVGVDVRIPPQRDPRSGRVRDEWLVREIDAGSSLGLRLALRMRTSCPDTDVTVVHLGPTGSEPYLRHALALGADRAVRVWDAETAGLHGAGKAVVLAAAAQAAGFDLMILGAAGVVDAGGQLGVLLAARLGVPCVTQAIDITPSDREGRVEVARSLDRGFRERVEATLPGVITVADGSVPLSAAPARASIAALLAAQEREILVWTLADLGVPLDEVRRAEEVLRHQPPRSLRPRLHRLAAPDPSLPAFERILELIEGSVQRRDGRVVRGSDEMIVDEVFQTLREEGWLDHLRRDDATCADTPDAAGRP